MYVYIQYSEYVDKLSVYDISLLCRVYNVRYTMYILHSTLYNVQCTINTIYRVHYTLYTIQYIVYTIRYDVAMYILTANHHVCNHMRKYHGNPEI